MPEGVEVSLNCSDSYLGTTFLGVVLVDSELSFGNSFNLVLLLDLL